MLDSLKTVSDSLKSVCLTYQQSLINPTNFSDVLNALAWPVVALLVFFLSRKHLVNLVRRVLKAPGWEFTPWTSTSFDHGNRSTASNLNASRNAHLGDYPASLYWFGADTMKVIDYALRGAPRNSVLTGLKHSIHHLGSLEVLNVETAQIIDALQSIRNRIVHSTDEAFDKSFRNSIAIELEVLIVQVGKLLQSKQPGFRPNPDGQ